MLAAVLYLWILASRFSKAQSSFAEKCLAFQPEKYIHGATRTVLQHVTAGTTLKFPDNDPTCGRTSQLAPAELCRVALSITTSRSSEITFEAWLPEDWSGRFLATGNGGIDGCIKYEDLAYGTNRGFATVGANNGHNGTGGAAFLNEPEIVVDFAWRSLHTAVEVGKELSKRFYQKSYSKSYYIGCSLGGRQGIKSAEKFPEDFDGVIAGAPGVDFNNLYSWRARFYTITGSKTGANFIPTDSWKTWIHDEVLRQCDTLDNAQDGIIEDASQCKFDVSTLHCRGNNTVKCLNEKQIQQLKTIYSDFRYPGGELIYPAMQPGNEDKAIDRLLVGAPFQYSEDWFKYVVYSNPSWNASSFDFAAARAAERLNPGDIRTFPAALPNFERRGGKILMYHGQADNQVTPFNTNRFYEHLRGRRSYDAMDKWVRSFRISGMYHCSGGPGAWALGQGGNAPQAGIPFDGQHNVLKAMVDWVEKGVAPEYIEGTKFVNDTVAAGIDMTRRHCKYPARNTFMGTNYKDPLDWECR